MHLLCLLPGRHKDNLFLVQDHVKKFSKAGGCLHHKGFMVTSSWGVTVSGNASNLTVSLMSPFANFAALSLLCHYLPSSHGPSSLRRNCQGVYAHEIRDLSPQKCCQRNPAYTSLFLPDWVSPQYAKLNLSLCTGCSPEPLNLIIPKGNRHKWLAILLEMIHSTLKLARHWVIYSERLTCVRASSYNAFRATLSIPMRNWLQSWLFKHV